MGSIPRCQFDSIFVFFNSITERPIQCAAGVVVSCKIPILATRVRFPGDAGFKFLFKDFPMATDICHSISTARVA